MSVVFSSAALAAEENAAAKPETNAPPAVSATTTQLAAQATAPAAVEPTEAEMREAVQRHLDNLNAQMRPAAGKAAKPWRPPAGYRGYGYRYYYRYSKESDYEDWTDVVARAGSVTRVQITSFKKIRCTPEPDQQGFVGEYVAELKVTGDHPLGQEILKTSGQRMQATFIRGDKGWIFGALK